MSKLRSPHRCIRLVLDMWNWRAHIVRGRGQLWYNPLAKEHDVIIRALESCMSDRLLYGQIRMDRIQLLQQRFAAMDGARFRPPTDVYETEDSIVVIIEVAGLQEGQFEISLSDADRLLTVVGRRQSHSADAGRVTFHQIEIPYGVFAVDVPMPWPLQEAEFATAEYNDGFLVITLQKAQPRHVPVRVIGEGGRT